MNMIKVSEASGPALDWMAAKALWGTVRISTFGPLFGKGFNAPCLDGRGSLFKPSTDWAQGGPIIERENIATSPEGGTWIAVATRTQDPCVQYGPTPLVAAMRCYVASKLGDTVDVPSELLK